MSGVKSVRYCQVSVRFVPSALRTLTVGKARQGTRMPEQEEEGEAGEGRRGGGRGGGGGVEVDENRRNWKDRKSEMLRVLYA